MNILFLTMNPFTDINMHNIYSDLMLEFAAHGHTPYIVTPREKRSGEKTELLRFENYALLKVQIGNTNNVSLIEKGISTVTMNRKYYKAVKKYLGTLDFGLILYSTPPITLAGAVKKLKKHFRCRTYLMLKDIFPQNAVDLGMFSAKSPVYLYFRAKEKALYRISDRIGCMSPANVEYLLKHNPDIPPDKVEICPNAIIPRDTENRNGYKRQLREKYCIPDEAIVYLYGGNLGKPQGIPFLIECLKANINLADRYFFICGSGSEYGLLESFVNTYRPPNVKLINFLPKAEYDLLAKGCDVGLVFLDYRFTIPNFPSRILSYMENEMPVIVCSDENTDIGRIVQSNGFGLSCVSSDAGQFTNCLNILDDAAIKTMGKKSRAYLEEYYSAHCCYGVITGEKD